MIRIKGRGNFGDGQARGQVNPIVDVQDGMADSELRRGEVLKTFENDLFDVRDPSAFGVFKIIKIRRAGDKDTALPAHDAIRESKPIREDCALIIMAVVMGVFEQNDLAYRL